MSVKRSAKMERDIIGKKFGKLTAIKQLEERTSNKSILWLCKCDCGNMHKTVYAHLKRGHSCGCIRKEIINSIKNKYEDCGEYYKGTTNKGFEFFIDKDDFEKVAKYSWSLDKDGYLLAMGKRNINLRMHKIILPSEGKYIDHINHNVRDNRKCNLRICTVSQNGMNKITAKNNTSGVKGVSWDNGRSRWIAGIGVNYKQIRLGYFKNIKDAIKAREEAEIKYFGEYRYIVV
jgi:hypothetical protein